jgi:hypothetical protein
LRPAKFLATQWRIRITAQIMVKRINNISQPLVELSPAGGSRNLSKTIYSHADAEELCERKFGETDRSGIRRYEMTERENTRGPRVLGAGKFLGFGLARHGHLVQQ